MAKKQYPPLTPIALDIKNILEDTLDSPREGIITGVTVSSVKIEQYINELIRNQKGN